MAIRIIIAQVGEQQIEDKESALRLQEALKASYELTGEAVTLETTDIAILQERLKEDTGHSVVIAAGASLIDAVLALKQTTVNTAILWNGQQLPEGAEKKLGALDAVIIPALTINDAQKTALDKEKALLVVTDQTAFTEREVLLLRLVVNPEYAQLQQKIIDSTFEGKMKQDSPIAIAMMGVSGTGKTTVLQHLAKRSGNKVRELPRILATFNRLPPPETSVPPKEISFDDAVYVSPSWIREQLAETSYIKALFEVQGATDPVTAIYAKRNVPEWKQKVELFHEEGKRIAEKMLMNAVQSKVPFVFDSTLAAVTLAGVEGAAKDESTTTRVLGQLSSARYALYAFCLNTSLETAKARGKQYLDEELAADVQRFDNCYDKIKSFTSKIYKVDEKGDLQQPGRAVGWAR